MSRDAVAEPLAGLRTPSARSAHVAKGTYAAPPAEAETEDLMEEASEVTFGLERDMQKALGAKIQPREAGLRILDGSRSARRSWSC